MQIVYSTRTTSTDNAAGRTRTLLDDLARDYPRGTVLLIGHHAQRVTLPHVADVVPLHEALAETMTNDWWQHEWEYRYGA